MIAEVPRLGPSNFKSACLSQSCYRNASYMRGENAGAVQPRQWRRRRKMSIFSNLRYLQKDNNKLAHVVILLITTCLLLGPSFLLSIVMSHFWPLYLIAVTETLGSIIGVVRFHRSSEGFLSGDALTRALNATSKVAQFPKNKLAKAH
jgi:hypothetical protein